MPKYRSIFISKHISSLFFGAFLWAVVPLSIFAVEPSSIEASHRKLELQEVKEVDPDGLNAATEEKQAILPDDASQEKVKRLENMVLIPVGGFLAGGDPKTGYKECLKHAQSCELEWFEHEGPSNWVWIDEFYMDKYEITQKDFEAMLEKNPSKFKGDNLPVERVLWKEANEYCKKAGKRLPTEAEWEKAAKGGGNTIYPWGNEVESGRANFCDTQCKKIVRVDRFDDGYQGTAPVGSYPPNGYGLYDMAGNVYEWVSDWYAAGYYRERPIRDPQGPFNGQDLFHIHGMKKVLRGGSWGNNASAMRVASRSWAHNSRVSRRGFRCAADVLSMP
jgi:formylglycine-generating enzyme required for sulfatase activity